MDGVIRMRAWGGESERKAGQAWDTNYKVFCWFDLWRVRTIPRSLATVALINLLNGSMTVAESMMQHLDPPSGWKDLFPQALGMIPEDSL